MAHFEEMVATRERWESNDLIEGGLGPHAAYSLSEECLRRIGVIPSEDDPISRIVWSGSPAAVRTVWVGGRRVVENGQVTSIDRAEVRSEMYRRAQRLAR